MRTFINLAIFFLLFSFSTTAQDQCVIKPYNGQPLNFVIGDEVVFFVENKYASGEVIPFNVNELVIYLDKFKISAPLIFEHNDGIQVRFSVPDVSDLIGNKILQFSNGLKAIANAPIIILGKVPDGFVRDVGQILIIGDDYKEVIIEGDNLTSVQDVHYSNDLVAKKMEIVNNGAIRLFLKSGPSTVEAKSVDLEFTFQNPNTGLVDSKKINFLIGVREKDRKQVAASNPDKFFLPDLTYDNRINFTVNLDANFKAGATYSFQSSELSFDPNSVKVEKNAASGTIFISVKLDVANTGSGVKQYQIVDKTNAQSFYGFLTFLKEPVIKSVNDITRTSLTYTPYESSVINIEGVNIGKTTFEVVNDPGQNTIIYKQKVLTDNRIEVDISFDKNNVELKKYKFRLVRTSHVGGQSQTHYYTYNDFIQVVRPKEIGEINNMVEYLIGDSEKVIKADEKELISVEKDDWKNIDIKWDGVGNNPDVGPQVLSAKISLYSENGELLEERPYYNAKYDGNQVVLGTGGRNYIGTEQVVFWRDIVGEFEVDVRPWNTIKVQTMHNRDYYRTSDVRPDFDEQEFVLKGNFWDNFSSTITLPPSLFVFGEKKVEGTYQWKAQVLPLNVGYGIKYQFRKSETGERRRLALGAYIAGLNYLQIDNEEKTEESTTVQADSTIVTEKKIVNDNLISKGALSGMLLFEVFLFNQDRKIQLPLQVGTGMTFPLNGQERQWFGVIGFGIDYNF